MSVANDPYQKYIPWYLYFLNRAYPEARKIVMVDRQLKQNVKDMMNLLSGNFRVIENAFPEYLLTSGKQIKCLRWLTFLEEFNEFKCLSIGDIDMAIYREEPSYMDQHLNHCKKTGLPYSNFIRPTAPRRVCGIHVVQPKEWFDIMRPIMCKYRALLKNGSIDLPSQGFNEQLLLKMIEESSLGTPPPNLSESYWSSLVTSNHHGTHIRLAEHQGIRGLSFANNYQYHKDQIIESVKTQKFQRLSAMSPDIGNLLRVTASAYEKF